MTIEKFCLPFCLHLLGFAYTHTQYQTNACSDEKWIKQFSTIDKDDEKSYLLSLYLLFARLLVCTNTLLKKYESRRRQCVCLSPPFDGRVRGTFECFRFYIVIYLFARYFS